MLSHECPTLELVRLFNPQCASAARVTVLGLCVCLCVCVFRSYKETKKKQNKNKGSVGYMSVLSQVCQTEIYIFSIFYMLVIPLSIAR